MKNIVFAFILIAATVALIWLIRLLTSGLNSPCSRPRVALMIYFDKNCECLEYNLDRIYSSPALRDVELQVTVVDCVATEESSQWLKALGAKLKKDFDIITEDESDGAAEYCYDQRNG